MRKHRAIRLPKSVINTLRDIRDSYYTPRPLPELVNAALRQTRVATWLFLAPTTRETTGKIDVWLDDEFSDLPHAEIVSRVSHATIGLSCRVIPDVVEINRSKR